MNKSIAEIPLDGPAPAIANAVRDATGARVQQIPMTPERVVRALQALRSAKPAQAIPAKTKS